MRSLFGALAFLVSLALAPAALAERLEDSVVRIHVSKRDPDPNAPWQVGEVSQQSYLGAVLPGGHILTTAWAVANATFVELQRFGASHRDEAAVEFVDYEVNLALVKPVSEGALTGTKPVSLGDDLAVDDQVDIYRARDAYQLSRMPASFQEVGLFSAVTSTYSLCSYLLKVQQTGLGWAEPVFRQGKLVAMTTGQDSNFVHALPMSIIKHFIDDHHDASYRGFPAMGVQLSSLTSPDMRRLLHADKIDNGIRISEVLVESAFAGKLQADDVLTEVEGVPISEHGFFTHPKWGKVHFKYLLNQHYAGDSLTIKVLRQGKEEVITGRLNRYDSNRTPVVAYRYDHPEPYLIFGGLVFQELSEDYLRQWGKDWRDLAPFDLLFTLDYGNKSQPDPKQRVIFMSRVLADDFNRGYGDLRHAIIDTVNDVKVTSMSGLREALAHPLVRKGKNYARIKFQRDNGEVILGYDGLDAAQRRIGRTYEIKDAAAFFQSSSH